MRIIEESPQTSYILKGITTQGIQVNEDIISSTLLCTLETYTTLPTVKDLNDLQWQDVIAYLKQGDIILLSAAIDFQHPFAQMCLRRSIAIEFMSCTHVLETTLILQSEYRPFLSVIFESAWRHTTNVGKVD